MNMKAQTQYKPTSVSTREPRGWPRAIAIGLAAGLATGVIVLIPVLILQATRGVGVVPEMQLAASSLIGMAAYAGAPGFILGTLLHFFVSIVPAIAYALVTWRVPAVNRWAWIGGPVLGLIVFVFMGFVVLPHSVFATPPSVTPMPFVPAVLIHMFALGLPIALIVQHGWTPGPKSSGSMAATSNSPIIEIVTAKLRDSVTIEQMEAVDYEIAATLISKRPGFLSRESAPGSDHSWLAVVRWRSMADADASMQSFSSAAIAPKFMSMIEPETLVMKRYGR